MGKKKREMEHMRRKLHHYREQQVETWLLSGDMVDAF
jgi:hypothetical protein